MTTLDFGAQAVANAHPVLGRFWNADDPIVDRVQAVGGRYTTSVSNTAPVAQRLKRL